MKRNYLFTLGEMNAHIVTDLVYCWCPCEFSVHSQIYKEAMISMFNSSMYGWFFF